MRTSLNFFLAWDFGCRNIATCATVLTLVRQGKAAAQWPSGPREHIAQRGRIPLTAPRRLNPARIEGFLYLSQPRRPRLPNLTDERQYVGCVVVGRCTNCLQRHDPPSFSPRALAAASAAFVRVPIMARSFSASAANS